MRILEESSQTPDVAHTKTKLYWYPDSLVVKTLNAREQGSKNILSYHESLVDSNHTYHEPLVVNPLNAREQGSIIS